jgi:Flp pilus assembly CpaF family ATPase
MTFLEAINTGHGGSMTTLHAETPQLAVQRLAIAALKTEIPMTYADMIQYIENSIDVIIQRYASDERWEMLQASEVYNQRASTARPEAQAICEAAGNW